MSNKSNIISGIKPEKLLLPNFFTLAKTGIGKKFTVKINSQDVKNMEKMITNNQLDSVKNTLRKKTI
ncbi:hypothetical protein AALB81_16290 [Lachnospiraceae bacterium 48-33]